MIVVVLGCSMSYAQSDDAQHISSIGVQDSVLVPVELIKIANSKMIELEYEKEINSYLRNIIQNDSAIYNALFISHDYYESKSIECEEAYIRDTKKYKKQRNILGGTSIGLLTILVLILL